MTYPNRSTHAVTKALLALAAVLAFVPTIASAAADHLQIAEVVMRERPGIPSFGSEYVKIHNPTAAAVDLSDVYLTDALYTGSGYWQLVEGGQAGGGGTGGDFNARFPDGTTLGAGETFVISLRGSDLFALSYPGEAPDFELFEDGSAPDAVPDMREAFPGAIAFGLGSTGTNDLPSEGWLGDSGESLVLYTWDGASDLVTDLDYVLWGTSNVYRVDKTGVSVDGPDADETATAYQADTPVAAQDDLAVHTYGDALVRTDAEETGETATGGNGSGGDDETSEPLTSTWTNTGDQTPASTGTGPAPSPIVTALEASPATAYVGFPVNVTATVLANDAVASATLHYSVDGGAWTDVAASAAGDDWSAQIPAQALGAQVAWWFEAVGTGGGTAQAPANAPFYATTYTVQEAPDPGDGPVHLLLTEVCVQGTDHEFVEIHNPTDEAVSLDDYYLTDAVYNDQGYWRLPEGSPAQNTVGGGDFNDFHARFPADAEIGPGETLTISIAGSDAFSSVWGMDPDFELLEDGGSADDVADMREIFPGSLLGAPDGSAAATLTNSAEILVLYYWDGVTELVSDVDMFMWGSSTSAAVDRTGYTIGSSTYQADTPVASQDRFMTAHEIGGTFERIDPSEGSEPDLVGNGPGGDDETGENVSSTWVVATAGTPGEFSSESLTITAASTSPARPNPDEPTTVTATVVNLVPVTGVTLSYAVDGGAYANVTCTDGGGGMWSGDIPTQALDAVVTWYVTATASGGDTAVWPAGAPGTVETFTIQEPLEPVPNPPKLLLTEVCVMGTTHEFVEIYNPTNEAVELDNYYLTDAVYNTQAYWRLPEGNPQQSTIGGGDFYDFHARFPADAVIQPGQSLTISIAGSDAFEGVWAVAPDFELIEDGSSSDDVPDLLDVFPGSRLGSPTGDAATLTNGAEIMVLYYWDQVSDLVKDIDMFMWGESTSARVYRNNYSINGTPYEDDTPVGSQDQFLDTHEIGQTFQRLDATEGAEPTTGGNGTLGHDETGEDLSNTWVVNTGTPGVFSEIVAGFAFSPPQPPAGTPSTFTLELVDVDGLETPDSIVFHYAVDGGSERTVDMTADETGAWSCSVPAFDEGVTVSWWVSVHTGEDVLYFPASWEAAPMLMDILAPFSLNVPAKTFLAYLGEAFPFTVTYPSGSEAQVRIFDLEGRVVRNLFDSRFDLGEAEINRLDMEWDGRTDTFELVKAGTYIIHLLVVDEITGQRDEVVAPAVVATTLSR